MIHPTRLSRADFVARRHTPHSRLHSNQSSRFGVCYMLSSAAAMLVGPRESASGHTVAVTLLPSRCRSWPRRWLVRCRRKGSDLTQQCRGPHGRYAWMWHTKHRGQTVESSGIHRDVKKQFSPELFFRSHLRTRVAAQRHSRGTRAGRRRRPHTPSGQAKGPGDLRMNRHAAVCPAVHLTF